MMITENQMGITYPPGSSRRVVPEESPEGMPASVFAALLLLVLWLTMSYWVE